MNARYLSRFRNECDGLRQEVQRELDEATRAGDAEAVAEGVKLLSELDAWSALFAAAAKVGGAA